MNKRFTTAFMAIIIMTLTFFSFGSSTSAEDDRVLRVGTDTNYVPFEFLDQETGEYIGFDIDLIDAIAEEIGFEYELNPMDYSGITPALQTGNLDIAIAGISITPERAETVDLSDPYYDAGTAIMVQEDSDIHTIEDLAGK